MSTQYTLDLANASNISDATANAILNALNPSLASLSGDALTAFEQQLEAIAGYSTTGGVDLTGVKLDANSSPLQPLYDFKYTAGVNEVVQAGSGFDTITGTNGDTITGSSSAFGGAKLYSSGGNEVLQGGSGSDSLYAGSGNDSLYGGMGDQTLTGSTTSKGGALLQAGSGNQVLKAGLGHDTLIGGDGNSTLNGSTSVMGHALLEAGSGTSVLRGGIGSDTLVGGDGSSTLYAGTGHDTMYGGSGDTTFVVTQATFKNDVFNGGNGHSVLDLTDLNKSQVAISTTGGVTSVAFGGNSLTLTGVNEIAFKDQSVVKLH